MFTNTLKTAAPDTNGSVTLTKKLTGNYQSTGNYTFNVSFRNLAPDTSYCSGETAFASDSDGNGYIKLKLGKDGSASFNGLPSSAEYRITENAGDYEPSFRITGTDDINLASGSAGKNTDLSTKWESCGGRDSVVFTNTIRRYQNITLRKAVTGGKASGKFHFAVIFSNLSEPFSSDAGTITPDENGSTSTDIHLSAGDSVKFSGVPVGTKYQITEKANAGTASYTITTDAPDGASGGTFVRKTNGNTESMKALSTAEETVDEGENATVTFLNIMPKSADVTLKKKVAGNFGDRSRFFRFTVSLTGADRNHSYTFDLAKGSTEYDGKKNTASITTDENGNGSADIWLKHNDTVVIKNLPLSAKYSVAEDRGEYMQSITADGKSVTSVSEHSVAPETIVFTNTNTAILPTGIAAHRNTIALACAAIILAVCFAFALLKRKRKTK